MTITQLIERAKLGALKKSFYQQLIALYLNDQFAELELVLQACPEAERSSDWSILFAKCLIANHEFHHALDVLIPIAGRGQKSINKDLLSCYEHLALASEGIALANTCFEESGDIYFLLKKISFLRMLGSHDEALSIFDEMAKNEEYQELKVEHIKYLSELNHPRFLIILKMYLDQHPENTQLRMLQFWHALHYRDKAYAFDVLMSIIYLFPVCIEAHLALIKFNIEDADINNARLNLLTFQDKFKTQAHAMVLMGMLITENPCLSLVFHTRFPQRIELPAFLKNVFSILNVPGTALYLVGSTIHNLLEHKPLTELADIDFVSNQPPLPSTRFYPSPFMPRLFSNFIVDGGDTYKCECFYNPLAPQEMIDIDVRSRDFTINSLYCDAEGNLFDPTGLGFLDLEHRIIRTIIASRTSLADDPIRILRAIKLIMKGFRVTDELEYALCHWMPTDALFSNLGHINAVMSKLLTYRDYTHILMHQLKKYGLLSKIYGFSQSEFSDGQLYTMLVHAIEETSPRARA